MYRRIFPGLVLFALLPLWAGTPRIDFYNKARQPIPNYQLAASLIRVSGLTPNQPGQFSLSGVGAQIWNHELKVDASGTAWLDRELRTLDELLETAFSGPGRSKNLNIRIYQDDRLIARRYSLATRALNQEESGGRQVQQEEYDILDQDEQVLGQGRLVFPTGIGENGSRLPLVILAHGNGFSYLDYSHLDQSLAARGFVVAAVASAADAGIPARRDDILLNLEYIYQRWGSFLSDDLVLIGHSRGGEAVIHAANSLARNPFGQVRVRTIISLAPSYEENLETPLPNAAASLLILYGTHDDDVTNEVGIGVKPFSPFRLFDQTWTENYKDRVRQKAMVLIHGADHAAFSNRANPKPTISPNLPTMVQQWACRTYISLWLRWQLGGESALAGYFKDTWRLYSLDLNSFLDASTQFDSSDHLLIDDFEDTRFKQNRVGGGINPSRELFITQGPAYELEAHSPHDSGVALIGWRDPADLWFDIPFKVQDLRNYSWMSFRVAQVYKDDWNLPAGEQSFRIAFCSRSGVQELDLADFQHLPYPVVVRDLSPDGWDYTVSAMRSIRIPLSAFDAIDLARVTRIGFIFRKAEAEQLVPGLILFDDLELQR